MPGRPRLMNRLNSACSQGRRPSMPRYSRITPSRVPSRLITLASPTTRAKICSGRAPIERRIAISRRRSLRLVSSTVSMPVRPTATTITETSSRAFSATPINCHSSARVAPGRIASSGSSANWLISRCTRKVAMRDFRPTKKAVMVFGVRSMRCTRSASKRTPGIGLPANQSLWIASMPRRSTCRLRSTGVPLGARMPTTVKGLSSCLISETSPAPCARAMRSPSL